MILLKKEPLTIHINERLGAEIAQIEVSGIELLAFYDWESPVAVSKSSTYGKQRHDWLSEYRGGWQFLMPNAGPECEVDGVNIPFHGEWSRTQVDIIAQTESMVRVRAGTRLPVVVEREISVLSDPDRVAITTEVRNTSNEPTSFIWGEHPAFFVRQGDKIDLPNGEVVNSAGASMIAIEPGSSCPDIGLAEARKRGQAIELMPGQLRKTTMSLIPFPATTSPVTNVSIDGDITLGR